MDDDFVAEVKAWAAEQAKKPASDATDDCGEITWTEDFIPSVYDQMVEAIRDEVITWTSSLAPEDCVDEVPDWSGTSSSAPAVAPEEPELPTQGITPTAAPEEPIDAPPPAYTSLDPVARHEGRQATLKTLLEISDRWEANGDDRLVEHVYHLSETLEGERNALMMDEDNLPPYHPTDPFAAEEAFFPFGHVAPCVEWMGHASMGPVHVEGAAVFEMAAYEAYEVFGRGDGTFDPDCAWADWFIRDGKLAAYPLSETGARLMELQRGEYLWRRSDMVSLWRCVAEDGLLEQEHAHR